MKSDAVIAILILVATGTVAGIEVGYVQGQVAALVLSAGVVTALMFSVAKGSGKVGDMAGNRGYPTDDREGTGQRFRPLSDADKEEIVDALFDKIFQEVGRSVVKKAFLVVLAIILAAVGWMAKNHIDIK